jgi:hypothetical protein
MNGYYSNGKAYKSEFNQRLEHKNTLLKQKLLRLKLNSFQVHIQLKTIHYNTFLKQRFKLKSLQVRAVFVRREPPPSRSASCWSTSAASGSSQRFASGRSGEETEKEKEGRFKGLFYKNFMFKENSHKFYSLWILHTNAKKV